MSKESAWTWERNTLDPGRVARAAKVKVVELAITDDECSGVFIGSEGTIYHATLQECDCPDFAVKHGSIPCKHILRLAMEAGIISKNGNTPEQQKKADIDSLRQQIASAYGFYHFFKSPIMSDKKYDQLKKDLQELEK